MKHKLFSFILVAACAAAALSCNKTAEEDFSLAPDQERDVYLTATMGYTPDTRAVSVSGEAISCTWNEGDQLDLALNGEVITKLTVTSVFGDRAMLSGKVKGAYPQGTQFTLFYGGTSYMYYGQSGTPESAGLRGYLKADVTIAEQDNKTLKLSAVTLEHQQAYFELRFRFGPDLIPVKTLRVVNMGPNTSTTVEGDSTEVAGKIVRSWELGADPEFNYFGTGSNAFAVSSVGTEAPTTVYFAMRDNTGGTGKLTYKFEVTDPSNRTYTAHPKDMGTGPIQNGRYYSGEWILDKKAVADGATLVEPTGIAGLVYNGEQQDLITAGMLKDNVSEEAGEGAEMKYFVRYFAPNVIADTSAPTADDPAWTSTLPQGKEPGTYYIYYQVIGGDYYKSVDPAAIAGNPVVIEKRTVSITAPTVITGLKYTGSAQALVNAGTVADKTDPEFFEDGLVMKYFVKSFALDYTPTSNDLAAPSTSATGWVSDVPVGTNAAKYYVWYKVDGNAHYYDYSENDETVLGSIMTPIAAAEAVVGNPVPIEGLVYNGVDQQLVLPADASEGCKVYYLVTTSATLVPTAESAATTDPYSTGWVLPTDTEPAKRAPKEKNAGTYYVWTRIVEDEESHNYTDAPGISAAPVVAIIGKADVTITPPTALTGLVYNGAMQNLVKTADETTHPDGSVTYTDFENHQQSALEGNTPNATLKYKITETDTAPTNWTDATVYPLYPQAKNGGTYYIWLKVEGGRNFRDKTYPDGVPVTIGPAPITTTAPTLASPWTYDGTPHNLITAAATVSYTASTGTASATADAEAPYKPTVYYTYRTDDSTPAAGDADWYTTFLPVTNAANYTVWYKVTGSRNFEDKAPTQVSSVIVDKKAPTYTAPTATNPEYNGADQELITALTISEPTSGMAIKYKLGEGDWGSAIPKATATGSYTVYYKADSSNPNYKNIEVASVQASITSASPTLATSPTVVAGDLTYTAAPQSLLSAGATLESKYTTGGCSLRYQVTTTNTAPATPAKSATLGDEWKENFADIKGENAGTYYIWTLIVGGANYNNVVCDAVTKAIGQQAGSITLDASSMTFLSTEGSSFTHYFNVTTHTGSLSAVSSDTDKADVSISGTTITVTRKTNDAVTSGLTITVTSAANTNYTEVSESIPVTMEAAAVAFVLDLSTVEEGSTPVVVADGYTITGTLGVNRQISIAGGATVTLDNVSINAGGAFTTGNHAGITCEGLATIILKDGTSNTVKGFANTYPGIYVPSGVTLVIQGNTGNLTASSNGNAAGIGAGNGTACGNIVIQGGTITATGGENAAGIGGASNVNCGDITINGGTITANGGTNAAGIGSGPGSGAGCGNITITTGVTKVTATKGSGAPYSIGQGFQSTGCGTITIGGTEKAQSLFSSDTFTYQP